MANNFSSSIIKTHKTLPARVTKITTSHGEVLTPAFMPVGTRAFVNHINPNDLVDSGSQIILGGNTYHMLCSPGMETIQAAGGMHQFMGWQGPMLTDSGGFQVFSLSKNSKICVIDENGARFKHPITGKMLYLTPESSIQAQKIIGADIIMAFDQCTPDDGQKENTLAAMERTHRWLVESKEIHERDSSSAYGYQQALFGIVQGGSFRDLREQSAEFITSLDLDGIALGGEVIGFDIAKTCEIIDWVRDILPENKTRYVMGVGLNPQDLIDTTARGVDIFDCVAPTRNARHGSLYCGKIIEQDGWLAFVGEEEKGRILIKKSIYAHDDRPIMEDCDCSTCRNFSRAYLHYLFKSKSLSYGYLASVHNIRVMHRVCEKIREIILR
ncbi:MAG: tRNA-guanine(34) transglycosylase [Gammaproteobacteria bacterium GWE2_37_16]|nr:MAG: tRNA-guanine(34) transglycosylase [Gammaproteobacteria bacterium GWE2_37_16]